MPKQKVVGEIKITVKIHEEDIDYIICGAVEGAINYWGRFKGYYHGNELLAMTNSKPTDFCLSEWVTFLILNGHTIALEDTEEPDEVWELTLDKLIKGIETNHSERPRSRMDNYDAEDYDCIMQYALFGEIVYG